MPTTWGPTPTGEVIEIYLAMNIMPTTKAHFIHGLGPV